MLHRRTALTRLPIALLLVAACASRGPAPPVYEAGSVLPPAEIEDQHGDLHRIDGRVRVVLFSRDMDGGAIIEDVLAASPDLLPRAGAVYVADISGMPGLIASTMAIPAMRKRGYPTLLDRDGTITAAYPSEPGKATVIVLEELEVREIWHTASGPELRAKLESGADDG